MSAGVGPDIPQKAREVRLSEHLEGELTLGHFDIVEVEVPEPYSARSWSVRTICRWRRPTRI